MEKTIGRFLELLSKPSLEVTNEEMQQAYGCFMEHIVNSGKNDNDPAGFFRMLHAARIELASLQSLYRNGQGEKRA